MTDQRAGSFEGLPSWAKEIGTTLVAASLYILSGNTSDFCWRTDKRAPATIANTLADLLASLGYDGLVEFDIGSGASITEQPGIDTDPRLQSFIDLADPESRELGGLTNLVEAIACPIEAGAPPVRAGLLVHRADQLVRDAQHLSDVEFEQFRKLDYLARIARPIGSRFNPVVFLTRNDWDLPTSFGQASDQVRRVVIGTPDRQTRLDAARMMLSAETDDDRPVDQFADQTSGMRLTEMFKVNSIRRDMGLEASEIVDAARSFRVGVPTNPWRQPQLVERLRNELGPKPTLELEVLGQPAAIEKSIDILIRSAVNLTAAHSSPSATRPRGVLFFAGPTGVGKTELAKQITRLIHGTPDNYVRFDMSEFSSEHSADRLVGAPPGYVGHESGGELTNAIRQDPFSVVLFDEIEKSDSRVLDKFLQVLDDGRLTDGRGETVYFTEAVLVFTSNLGIYVDDIDRHGHKVRRPNVEPGIAFDELSNRVRSAIGDHFTEKLERPELLNRIGLDNIVVFDFISREVGADILTKMVDLIEARVRSESPDRADWLEVPANARNQLAELCLTEEVLYMGGRGIGSRLETVFVNPLSRALFQSQLARIGPTVHRVDGVEANQLTARVELTSRPA